MFCEFYLNNTIKLPCSCYECCGSVPFLKQLFSYPLGWWCLGVHSLEWPSLQFYCESRGGGVGTGVLFSNLSSSRQVCTHGEENVKDARSRLITRYPLLLE